jgi:predicted permease
VSFLAILGVTVPLAAVIALGFLAVWRGWFPATAIPGVGAFVRNFAIPAAIFAGLSVQDFGAVFHGGFVLAFTVASLLSFLLTYVLVRGPGGEGPTPAALLALVGSMSNGIMIGMPLVIALFGTLALATIAQQLLVENLLIIPLALLLADLGRSRVQAGHGSADQPAQRLLRVFSGVARNPIVVATLLGLAFAGLPVSVPGPVERAVALLAGSAGGLALFFVGASLFGTDLSASLNRIAAAVTVKMLLHPLVVLGVFWVVMLGWQALGWLPANPVVIHACLIIASLPTGGMLPAIAARYGQDQPVSLALAVMTLISLVSAPLTVWLVLRFQPFG